MTVIVDTTCCCVSTVFGLTFALYESRNTNVFVDRVVVTLAFNVKLELSPEVAMLRAIVFLSS